VGYVVQVPLSDVRRTRRAAYRSNPPDPHSCARRCAGRCNGVCLLAGKKHFFEMLLSGFRRGAGSGAEDFERDESVEELVPAIRGSDLARPNEKFQAWDAKNGGTHGGGVEGQTGKP